MMKAWIMASRPKTLIAAVAPVFMGTAYAASLYCLHLPSFVCTLLAAIFIQIGTNFANDYFDYLKGADTSARKGPTRVMEAELVSKKAMKQAIVIVFGLAALCSLYLFLKGGTIILWLLALSVTLGILYTAGPYSLAYTGLSDPIAFLFFGPIATVFTVYLQTHSFEGKAFLIGCIPGCFALALLTVNNLRDIETDKLASKKTLAVRFGPRFAKIEYLLSVITAFGICVFLAITSRYLLFLSLLLIPLLIQNIIQVYQQQELNKVLENTAKLYMRLSILFSLAWVINL